MESSFDQLFHETENHHSINNNTEETQFGIDNGIGKNRNEISHLSDLFNDLNFELENLKVTSSSSLDRYNNDNDSDDGINMESQKIHHCGFTYNYKIPNIIANNNNMKSSSSIIPSSSSENHLFTPMSLNDVMKLETPKTRIDEYLKEIRRSYYNNSTTNNNINHNDDYKEDLIEIDSSLKPTHQNFDTDNEFIRSISSQLYENYLCDEEMNMNSFLNDSNILDNNANIFDNKSNIKDEKIFDRNEIDKQQPCDMMVSSISEQPPILVPLPHDTSVNTNNNNSSNNTGNSCSNSKKKVMSKYSKDTNIKDLLIHGDFCIWSSGHSKLFGAELCKEYIGLHTTALTHNNDRGVLVPAFPNGKENSLDPLYAIDQYMTINDTNNTLTKSQSIWDNGNKNNINGINCSKVKNTNDNLKEKLKSAGISMKGEYFAVHLMECVVRPDIEGSSLLESIASVARICNYKFAIIHSNHIVITPYESSNNLANSSSQQITSTLLNLDEMSRNSHKKNCTSVVEIKEFDLIDIQVVVSRVLRHRVIVCQFLRRIPRVNITGLSGLIIHHLTGGTNPLPLSQCPKSKLFLSKLKRELAAAKVCLSALYTVPITTVCGLPYAYGLDPLFRTQLHALLWILMWQQLELDIKTMTEYLLEKQKECIDFVEMLIPMFKLYNIPTPSFCEAEPVVVDPPVFIPAVSSSDSAVEITTKPLQTNEATTATVAIKMSRRCSPNRIVRYSTSSIGATIQQSQYDNNNYCVELSKLNKVDGMTFCLVMLDECYRELQFRCDEDYMNRIEFQNKYIVAQVAYINEYKKAILQSISNNQQTMESNFMKSFNSTFQEYFTNTTTTATGTTATISVSATASITNTYSASISTPNKATATTTAIVATGTVNSEEMNKGITSKSWFDGISSIFSYGPSSTKTTANATITPNNNTTNIPFNNSYLLNPTLTNPVDSTLVFIPKEKRKKQSISDVQQRLEYNAIRSQQQQQQHQGDVISSERTIADNEMDETLSISGASYYSDYNNGNENINNNSNNESNEINNNINTTKCCVEVINNQKVINSCLKSNTVLYYCACLVDNSMPGTIYITSSNIYVSSSSLLSLNPKKIIIYPLKSLSRTILPNHHLVMTNDNNNGVVSLSNNTQSTSSISSISTMLNSNSLKLIFNINNNEKKKEKFGDNNNTISIVVSPFVIDCKKLQILILEIKESFDNFK